MTRTIQRKCIYDALSSNALHPTAEQLFAIVREQLPNISLGTVYRNLNTMADKGMIRRLTMPNASDRYDARCDTHDHMICTVCGAVHDFVLPDAIMPQIATATGMQVQGYQLIAQGICAKCQAKQP